MGRDLQNTPMPFASYDKPALIADIREVEKLLSLERYGAARRFIQVMFGRACTYRGTKTQNKILGFYHCAAMAVRYDWELRRLNRAFLKINAMESDHAKPLSNKEIALLSLK